MTIVEGFQLSQCKGIEMGIMDNNSEIKLIKAPVAKVSAAITQLHDKAKVYTDVLGSVIQKKIKRRTILFQLKGFDWSIIYIYYGGWKHEDLLSRLSSLLQTRSMCASLVDHYLYHRVWDNGESVEHISIGDGEFPFIKFESQIRELREDCNQNDALYDFYCEQGVYYPEIRVSFKSQPDNQSAFKFKVSGYFDWCLREQFKKISSKDCGKEYPLDRSYFEGFYYITFDE